MATTSPDNLWSPDSSDGYDLTVDLAAMQGTVQTALNTVKVPDTGWVSLPMAPGWSGAMSIRRYGAVVTIAGYANKGSVINPGDSPISGAIPAQFRPANTVGAVLMGGVGGSGVGVLMAINNSGVISLHTLAGQAANSLTPTYTWMIPGNP